MVKIEAIIKVEACLGGAYLPLSQILPSDPTCAEFTVHRPKSSSLCCWIGGEKNNELSIAPVDPDTNLATISLNVHEDDVDTIKFLQTMDIVTPQGTRPYILACNFMSMHEFCDLLEKKQRSFAMCSNFDKNSVILSLHSNNTRVDHLRALKLSPSILLNTSEINAAIDTVSGNLQKVVSSLSIPVEIGATQFVPMNTKTFLPMQSISSCYALIPHLFQNIDHVGIPLTWHLYDMYQSIHTTQLHPSLLVDLDDKELILYFGCPMIQNRCNCALASPYSEDLTTDKFGRVTVGTEEIGLTFNQLALRTQNQAPPTPVDTPHYSFEEAVASLKCHRDELCNTLRDTQYNPENTKIRERNSIATCLDDCENGAQGFIIQHKALGRLYRACNGNENVLASMMINTASKSPHLFANIPDSLHRTMAPVLLRLAKLIHSKKWNTSMTVVTARNRAMSADNSIAPQLAGHGVCLAQVIDQDNSISYIPMEATTSMKVQPSKASLGLETDVACKMQDGTIQRFTLSEWATIFAQNTYNCIAISPFSSTQCSVSENCDYLKNWKNSPFYMGVFYSGFIFLPLSTGSIPCMGSCFGAPLSTLGSNQTFAMPISKDTTGIDQNPLKEWFRKQTLEAWPPPAREQDFQNMMAHWAPVQPIALSSLLTKENYKNYITTCISSSFDDRNHVLMAHAIHQRFAKQFTQNQIASSDDDDGHRIFPSTAYHGALINIRLKIQKDGKPMKASAIGNMLQTTQQLGLQHFVQFPQKTATVSARMGMPSKHAFYKCDQGNGIVHAFNHKLA